VSLGSFCLGFFIKAYIQKLNSNSKVAVAIDASEINYDRMSTSFFVPYYTDKPSNRMRLDILGRKSPYVVKIQESDITTKALRLLCSVLPDWKH
jgi:hypothetical protein